jgi:chromosome segregation and condensation protein ScpB
METTETKKKVLEAIKKAGKPVAAGEIVEATGLERKEVDKAMNALKKNRRNSFSNSLQMGNSI